MAGYGQRVECSEAHTDEGFRTEKVVNTPLVSIVIPFYNEEAFVGTAIASALAQTYQRREVILVDDGSTDNGADVVRSFGSDVQLVRQSNRGGCVARNRGIELARGEFIQFLDADDLLFPEKLTRQVPMAQAHSYSLTYTDHQCRWMDRDGTMEVRAMAVTDPDPFVFILRHKTLHTSGPLYHREWLLEIGGFQDGLPRSQEFEMNLRLAVWLSTRDGSIIHIPEVLFEVRRRVGSISSDTASTYAVKADYLPGIVAALEAGDHLNDHRRKELAGYCASVGRHCLRGGEMQAGLKLIKLAEQLDRRYAENMAWGAAARIVKRLLGPVAVERISKTKSSWRRRGRNFS